MLKLDPRSESCVVRGSLLLASGYACELPDNYPKAELERLEREGVRNLSKELHSLLMAEVVGHNLLMVYHSHRFLVLLAEISSESVGANSCIQSK